MPTPSDIAGQNLAVLQTYAPDTFKQLEKMCRDDLGDDKKTRKNMLAFLIAHGFAKDVAPGHGSSKPGKGKDMQPGTKDFVKAVAKAMK